MAFVKSTDFPYFQALGGQSKRGNVPAHYGFASEDAKATIAASGYFNVISTMFSPGDVIEVTRVLRRGESNECIIEKFDLQVGTIASGVVTVTIGKTTFSKKPLLIPFFFNQTDLLAGTTQYLPCPVAGVIAGLRTVIQTDVTTGGVIGVTNAGTAVAGMTITVADSPGAGLAQSATPTAGSSTAVVAASASIGVTATAAFDTAGAVHGFVEVMPFVDDGAEYAWFFTDATDLATPTSQFIPSAWAGTVDKIWSAIQVAIVTGGALTVEIETAAVTGLSITVADAATVGTVQSDTATTAAAIAEDADIEIVPADAFNGGGAINGCVRVVPTVATKKMFAPFFANETDVLAGTSHYVPAPIAGRVTEGMTITQLDVGTGGAVTVELATVAVAGLSITVANAASAGDMDRDQGTFRDWTSEITKGTAIEVVFDAAFATTGALNGLIEVTPYDEATD
jgi:hypothetical protein